VYCTTPDFIEIDTRRTRSSATAEGPRDALSVEILLTATQLFDMPHITSN